MKNFINNQKLIKKGFKKGYITLIAVIIVLAAASVIAISLILLGIGFSRSSSTLEKSNQAKAIVNACAEKALQQIRDDPLYSGSGNLNLGLGSCNYAVLMQSNENRQITASGSVGTIIRKLKINIDQINPSIRITSWQEVADL